jgi:hypothetical protein
VTSFPAQARRVRDTDLSLHRRLLALRECTLHFAPYGFRATWHHLILNAGIPQRLEQHPGSLLQAIDELDEARQLWQAQWRAFAQRRRAQKATGRRTPPTSEDWLSSRGRLAFCPDPAAHPTERLAVVLDRMITAHTSGPLPTTTCPACGHWRQIPPCTRCGVDPRGPTRARALTGPEADSQWRQIWQRTFVS